jgi:apolipoprotein N-acyltransferase
MTELSCRGLFLYRIKSPLFYSILIICLHSVITYLSWYIHPLLSLISFIPLLNIITCPLLNKKSKHIIVYLLFFITNVIVTWWLIPIDKSDGYSAFALNALYLYLSLPLSLVINRITKNLKFSFILSYFFIEWLHFRWLFAWPWLTLGNVFGSNITLIQWYKFTGVIGGSAWILTCNYFISQKKFFFKKIFLIILPITISLFLYYDKPHPKLGKNKFTLILSQPNIKYKDSLDDAERINQVFKNLESTIFKKDSINLILLPELFLNNEYWKETFLESATYLDLQKYISENYKNSTLLLGATLRKLKSGNNNKVNSHFLFDKFNVIIAIDSTKKIKYKSKKEFIPKLENWPNPLNKIIPSSNSANYSKSYDQNYIQVGKTKIFLAICYETLFTNYCSEASQINSDFMVILASESFLKSNNVALKQYLNICRVRAIENNQYLVKCSNEGYSAIVSPKGEIEQIIINDKSNYIRCEIPVK